MFELLVLFPAAGAVLIGTISTNYSFSWAVANSDNTIAVSAGGTIFTFNSPVGIIRTPIREVNVSTLAVNSFVSLLASRQYVCGLEQGFIQIQSMDINYQYVRQGKIKLLSTPVTMLVSKDNMYYGLNIGFVQAYNSANDAMTVLFSFEGLPLWLGYQALLNVLVLHTNGLVHIYYIETGVLLTIPVPIVTSNYNYIEGDRLLLTSGASVYAFRLSTRQLEERYDYTYNPYSIVSHSGQRIYFITFTTSLIGAFYRDKQIALYGGFGVKPRLTLTAANNVIAYSQEGIIMLFGSCPTETGLAKLVNGVCQPCYITFANCKLCTVSACLDTAIAQSLAVVSCTTFFEGFCLYKCPHAYLPDKALGCVQCRSNCTDYTVAGLYYATQKGTRLNLYLRISTLWILQRTSNINSYFSLNLLAGQKEHLLKSVAVVTQSNETRTLMAGFQIPKELLGVVSPNMRVNFSLAIAGLASGQLYISRVQLQPLDRNQELLRFRGTNAIAGFVVSALILVLLCYSATLVQVEVEVLQPLQVACLAMIYTSTPSSGLEVAYSLASGFLLQLGQSFEYDDLLLAEGYPLTQLVWPSHLTTNTILFSNLMLVFMLVTKNYRSATQGRAFTFLVANCELPLLVPSIAYFLVYSPLERGYMLTEQSTIVAIVAIVSALLQRTIRTLTSDKLEYWRIASDLAFSVVVALILGFGQFSRYLQLLLTLAVLLRFLLRDFTNRLNDRNQRLMYALESFAGVILVLAGVVNIEGALAFSGFCVFYAVLCLLRFRRSGSFLTELESVDVRMEEGDDELIADMTPADGEMVAVEDGQREEKEFNKRPAVYQQASVQEVSVKLSKKRGRRRTNAP